MKITALNIIDNIDIATDEELLTYLWYTRDTYKRSSSYDWDLPDWFFITVKTKYDPFKKENYTYNLLQETPKPDVPQSLRLDQIRLAVIQFWVSLSDIDNMIENMKEPDRSMIYTLRHYAPSIKRDDDRLIAFGWALWLNNDQIDQLFIIWSTL